MAAGTEPTAIHVDSPISMVRWRRKRAPPTVFVTAPYAKSVPTAVTGLIPKTMISSGVIRDPPPMPVSPTSVPTPNPNTTISGSKRPPRLVQPALRLVGVGPAASAPVVGRQRAVRAADRGVAAIVQLVVRHVVAEDVIPHLALGPVGQWVGLPEAVAEVPVDLLGAAPRHRLLAAQSGHPAIDIRKRALQRRDLPDPAALVRVARPQRVAMRSRLLLQRQTAKDVDRDVVLRLEGAPGRVRLVEQHVRVQREEAR